MKTDTTKKKMFADELADQLAAKVAQAGIQSFDFTCHVQGKHGMEEWSIRGERHYDKR